MLTLQEYIGKVNKLLIFSFPIFVLFCILFVSHMPAPTELKNPPPKMEKPLIYEVKPTRVRLSHNFKKNLNNIITLIQGFISKEIYPRTIQDTKEDIKIIYYIGFNRWEGIEGMSTFSECEFSKCILTTNEEFILRKHRNGITKFDAVAINIESLREDEV